MNKKGFTLIEVIVAIVLGLIVISTILPILTHSWSSYGHSRAVMDVSQIIERQIDSFRLFVSLNPEENFAKIKDSTENLTLVDNSMTPALTMNIVGKDVMDHKGQPVSDLTALEITASWGTGKNDTLRITAYVAKDF